MSTLVAPASGPDLLIRPSSPHKESPSRWAMNPRYAAMGSYVPRHVTIASIFPEDLEASMNHKSPIVDDDGLIVKFSSRTTYRIDGAPKGEYRTLKVFDTFTLVRDIQDPESPAGMKFADIYAPGLANDLIFLWAGNAIEVDRTGAHIGISVLSMDHAHGENGECLPSQGELDSMLTNQVNYFRVLIEKADRHYFEQSWKNINEEHRRAAAWMGVTDRKWFEPITAKAFKACPWCRDQIPVNAMGCKSCGTNLLKFYQESNIDPAIADPDLMAVLNQWGRKLTQEEVLRQKVETKLPKAT